MKKDDKENAQENNLKTTTRIEPKKLEHLHEDDDEEEEFSFEYY